jgi:hypothetical protein
MNTLGWDIYLDVTLQDFDRSDVMQKSQIVLEQAKQLPVKTDSMFTEKVKAPCGGYIRISLMAKRSAANARKIFDECKKIPAGKWYSHLGTFYNKGQKAIQHIWGIGKAVERVIPDAFQTLKLSYELSVTEEKKLTYWMGLIRQSDNITLLVFRGEFRLE